MTRPGWRHSCKLQEAGWSVGRNLRIETRWGGNFDRFAFLYAIVSYLAQGPED
jgi:hypothetical protein